MGKDEVGEINEDEALLRRLLTSVVKLTTGKQGVAVASEVLEAHGGAGYAEDTGLPVLLRDSQVLPIWEGTTNVLALDTLRALAKEPQSLAVLARTVDNCVADVADEQLAAAGRVAQDAVSHAQTWLQESFAAGRPVVEAGARRFGLTLGRALSLALLVEQAHWSLTQQQDGRSRAAAIRFAHSGIDQLADFDLDETAALAMDLG
jgi:acyl-CoA dehydrogenase